MQDRNKLDSMRYIAMVFGTRSRSIKPRVCCPWQDPNIVKTLPPQPIYSMHKNPRHIINAVPDGVPAPDCTVLPPPPDLCVPARWLALDVARQRPEPPPPALRP